MLYISTRGIQPPCKPSEALRQGVPADGGLFVPQTIPQVDQDWIRSLSSRPYYQAVANVLELYLTDFSAQELEEICETVYSEVNFGDRPAFLEQINPYNPYEYLLRLDSGPTASGKSYSMMLNAALESGRTKDGDRMQQLLLTATTGNAGIAALTYGRYRELRCNGFRQQQRAWPSRAGNAGGLWCNCLQLLHRLHSKNCRWRSKLLS